MMSGGAIEINYGEFVLTVPDLDEDDNPILNDDFEYNMVLMTRQEFEASGMDEKHIMKFCEGMACCRLTFGPDITTEWHGPFESEAAARSHMESIYLLENTILENRKNARESSDLLEKTVDTKTVA
jgi:hypothetical protein